MLYIVKRVTGVDSGLNGSPLSVTFESYFHKKYCLQFPRYHGADTGAVTGVSNGGAPLVFDPPLLEVYSQVKSKKADGGIEVEWQKDSKPVSWREARKILQKLRRHMIGVGEGEHGVYEAMLHASKNEGRA